MQAFLVKWRKLEIILAQVRVRQRIWMESQIFEIPTSQDKIFFESSAVSLVK